MEFKKRTFCAGEVSHKACNPKETQKQKNQSRYRNVKNSVVNPDPMRRDPDADSDLDQP